LKSRLVADGDLREHLSIEADTGLLESAHELAVRQAVRFAGSADADNPELAEVTLLEPAADVGIPESLLDGFLSGSMQLALGEKKTFRAL
jgi:hypothetical protein